MSEAPLFQPLFDRVLAFATRPALEPELSSARAFFFCQAGEPFEDDRSFEARTNAFFDWYVFDRPLSAGGEPPVREFGREPWLEPEEAFVLRLMGRTVHGLFEALHVDERRIRLEDLPSGARYELDLPNRLAGLEAGDLFEARLVPFAGGYRFSRAFLFHPRELRPRLRRVLARPHGQASSLGRQEFIWMLARMGLKAEHYRSTDLDVAYDFASPPPAVPAARMKFDRASIDARLGRLPASEG